jgi:hypothetical protein
MVDVFPSLPAHANYLQSSRCHKWLGKEARKLSSRLESQIDQHGDGAVKSHWLSSSLPQGSGTNTAEIEFDNLQVLKNIILRPMNIPEPKPELLHKGLDRKLQKTPSEGYLEYFLPGYGISREVIFSHLHLYLGPQASVRPYEYQEREGYLISAPSAMTMVSRGSIAFTDLTQSNDV